MAMNYIDIAVSLLLLLSAFHGYRRGFVMAIFSLLALILGIIGAVYFSDVVANWLMKEDLMSQQLVHLVSFLITFVAILIGINLAGKGLHKAFDMAALGLFNRIVGSFFALVRTALVLSFLFYAFEYFNHKWNMLEDRTILKESKTYYPMEQTAEWMIHAITSNDWFKSFEFEDLQRDIEQKVDDIILEQP